MLTISRNQLLFERGNLFTEGDVSALSNLATARSTVAPTWSS